MKTRALQIVALVLLIAVLVVFISPAVDLDPTALRSMRSAQALLMGILAIATALTGFLSQVLLALVPMRDDFLVIVDDHLFDLNCSRLC